MFYSQKPQLWFIFFFRYVQQDQGDLSSFYVSLTNNGLLFKVIIQGRGMGHPLSLWTGRGMCYLYESVGIKTFSGERTVGQTKIKKGASLKWRIYAHPYAYASNAIYALSEQFYAMYAMFGTILLPTFPSSAMYAIWNFNY